jgi:hypothetical protein
MDLTHSKVAGSAPVPPRPETGIRNEPQEIETNRNASSQLRAALATTPPKNLSSTGQSLAYGLPCANCHLYYPANLDACPCCNSKQRVSASVAPAIAKPAASHPQVDAAAVEREREAFLRQFRSQHPSGAAEVTKTPVMCRLSNQHAHRCEPASICRACYEQLQERVDVLEASLHIDLKEAAQIVYQAVWADPSDPAKTYANAAAALLAELRKRAGISSVLSQHRGN